jgi:ubiquinone biosynthesis protein
LKKIAQTLRLLHINRVLLRNGLDEMILTTNLFRPLSLLRFLSPWSWFRGELPANPVRIRRTLEELGPIFIKFGQILSTRRDLLPDDLADELALLQDRVPPFCGSEARKIIEAAFGHPIEEVLSDFDEKPLASASIAQVHTATLKDGRQVVVKVLRPGIEKTIRRDVDLLYTIAGLANRFWSEGKRLRPLEIVQEYEKTIFDELDLMREAANCSQLRRNFLNSEILYVPEIHWDLARKNVLVMERIHGTNVSDIKTLKAQGVSMELLGSRGVEIFFTQVFRDNFFHADMHPGNIFVEPSGRYISVDFGIMGTLTEEDKRYLAENLLAFFNRDYHRVATLHVESGWVPATTRVEDFESAIRTVCEPIFDRPLSEISFGHFLLNLFQTARRYDMEVQPQLVLLQKTLLNIEGLGRQLYPQLDLWTTAKPFLENWMDDQVGRKAMIRKFKENLPLMAEQLPDLPLKFNKVVDDAAAGRLEINWKSEELTQLRREMGKSQRRIITSLIGATLLVSGVLLITLGPSVLLSATATTTLAALFGLSGGAMLLSSLIAALR